jgi:chemosensory pili system protein ChpA (sensor histidine kinase/response regulator)
MQPEQQQRIMGYFIEEAKDHLNTLEQGLLNLQSTIDDPEMVNEVFRAAHSIKGGAAMLGLSSIQKTAHRLEDYFKILKETSKIKPDQKLETLLLQVFDTLQELLEHLQTPSGLTDEVASAAMAGIEPVFEELGQYFTRLEQHATNSGIAEPLPSTKATIVQTTVGQADEQSQDHALAVVFQSDVPAQLREMLQLFRQAETLSDGRDRLQNLCQDLRDLGEAFELASWSNLLEVARQAIAYSENSYRVLAPIIIKEIKHAQNLVLLGRSQEISPSSELQALVPAETAIAVDSDLASFFAMADGLESTTDLDFSGFDLAESDTSELDLIDFDLATPTPSHEAELAELSFDEMFDLSDFDSVSGNGSTEPLGDSSEFSEANRNGPQVGMAELNSLADLFEGEVPDLGSTWQEEKVIHTAASEFNHTAGLSEDASDFSDLFAPSLPGESTSSSENDLASLFGDDLLEAIDSSHSMSDQTLSDPIEGFELSELSTDEMLDLGEELSTYDHAEASSSPAGSDSADSSPAESGLADLENFFNLEDFDALETNDATPDELSVGELKEGEENALTSLGNLDDLFEGLGGSDLNFASAANESFDDLLGAENDLLSTDHADDELLFNELDSEEIRLESSTADEAWLDGFDFSVAEDDVSVSVDATIDSLLDGNSSSDQPEELSTEAIADLTQQDDLASLAALSDPWSVTLADSPNLEETELDLFSEGLDNHDTLSEFNANLEASYSAETGENQIDSLEELDFGLESDAFEASASRIEPELAAEVELELDDLLDPSLDALSADESDLFADSQDAELDLEFDSIVDTLDEPASLDVSTDSSTDRSLDAELPENDLFGSEGFALSDLDDLLDETATDPLSAELSEFDLNLEELGDDSLELSNSDPVAANLDESVLVDFASPEANLSEMDFATTELNDLFGAGGADDVEPGNTLDSADSADQLLDEFFNGFEAADSEDPEELSGLTETAAAEESADDVLASLTDDREDSSVNHDDWLGFTSTGADDASTDEASLSLDDLLISEGFVSLNEDVSVADPLSEDDFLGGSEGVTSEIAEEIDIFGDSIPVSTLEDLDRNLGEAPEGASLPVDIQDGLSTEFDLMNSSDELLSDLMSSSSDDLELEELDFAEEPSLEGAVNSLDSADLSLSGFESELATNLTEDNLDLDLDLDDLDLLSDDDSDLSTPDLEGLDGGLEDILFSTEDAEQQDFNLLNGGIAASMAGLGIALSAHHSNTENLHEEPSPSSAGDLDDLDDLNLDGLDLNDLNFNDSNLSDLDGLLEDDSLEDPNSFTTSGLDDLGSDLDFDLGNELETGLEETDEETEVADDFDHLDALLSEESATSALTTDSFADLESLLSDAPPTPVNSQTAFTASDPDAEFDDLEKMLEDANQTMGGSPTVKGRNAAPIGRRATRPNKGFSEQTMRVPVKHLDNLSNLVGELVVNRNSLEQDQERLRQSLDNLLYQVQQLSDVGQRMQDLYERSLLESSLLASRQHHRTPFGSSERHSGDTSPTGVEYDPLEMDRFTGFHSLSQEMIELIVRVRESASDIEFIVDETDQVTRMFRQVTTQLQEGLTRSRMVPFAQAADRLPRAVRDIAMKCGRQAELVIEGRETLIDKMILEHLYDPLTHLVNNAISHGIESPDVRQRAGKSPVGQITICAFHQGNQTVISVSDDGAGIDIERVKTKAIEKGLITSAEALTMSRLDIYDLLFHPGFSTKDQADDFSGRGVGMDVVRTSLNEIRGAINTDSIQGKGTTFTIRLPLTLSISKALCCISDRARIAFPMDGVEDMLDIPKERIQTNAEGQASIAWRDVVLPLRPLSELLSYSRHLSRGTVYGGSQDDDMVSVVVLRSAGNYLALQVDQVLGEQEIVIKQLEGPIPKPIGVAGATVLGDGRIMPIADVLELIDLSMGRIRRDVGSMWEQDGTQGLTETVIAKTEPMVLIVDDSITVRELLSMTFNKVGYRVEQARDGQEAWEKLRSGLPCNIVFCDIEMPRMDGLELLSRIQKDPNLNSLPIAMLTSRGADRHRQMAASLGASGYFTKPYLEEALLDAAQRMLKGEVLMSSSS